MANLANDEISRIQQEDMYRSKVQKELASQFPENWATRLWKFFNSTIIIAIAFLAMGWYGAERVLTNVGELEVQRENVLAAKKLKIEIDYRATLTKEYLENITWHEKNSDNLQLAEITSTLLVQTAGLVKLLSQLKLISGPGSSVQKALDGAITSTVELQRMSAEVHGNQSKKTINDLVEKAKKQLDSLVVVTGKPYLTNGESSDL